MLYESILTFTENKEIYREVLFKELSNSEYFLFSYRSGSGNNDSRINTLKKLNLFSYRDLALDYDTVKLLVKQELEKSVDYLQALRGDLKIFGSGNLEIIDDDKRNLDFRYNSESSKYELHYNSNYIVSFLLKDSVLNKTYSYLDFMKALTYLLVKAILHFLSNQKTILTHIKSKILQEFYISSLAQEYLDFDSKVDNLGQISPYILVSGSLGKIEELLAGDSGIKNDLFYYIANKNTNPTGNLIYSLLLNIEKISYDLKLPLVDLDTQFLELESYINFMVLDDYNLIELGQRYYSNIYPDFMLQTAEKTSGVVLTIQDKNYGNIEIPYIHLTRVDDQKDIQPYDLVLVKNQKFSDIPAIVVSVTGGDVVIDIKGEFYNIKRDEFLLLRSYSSIEIGDSLDLDSYTGVVLEKLDGLYVIEINHGDSNVRLIQNLSLLDIPLPKEQAGYYNNLNRFNTLGVEISRIDSILGDFSVNVENLKIVIKNSTGLEIDNDIVDNVAIFVDGNYSDSSVYNDQLKLCLDFLSSDSFKDANIYFISWDGDILDIVKTRQNQNSRLRYSFSNLRKPLGIVPISLSLDSFKLVYNHLERFDIKYDFGLLITSTPRLNICDKYQHKIYGLYRNTLDVNSN